MSGNVGSTNTVFGIVERWDIQWRYQTNDPDVNDYISALAKAWKPVIEQAGGADVSKVSAWAFPTATIIGLHRMCSQPSWRTPSRWLSCSARRCTSPFLSPTTQMQPLSVKWPTVPARGMKDFIVITLGTGVGSGIVIGGNMVYGHDGFAGGGSCHHPS